MTSRRNLIKRLIAGEPVERCGFWLGKPHVNTWPILHAWFGTKTEEELRLKLRDDVWWIRPQFTADTYHDPTGRTSMFDSGLDRAKHGSVGPLANCATLAEVDAYPWPSAKYLSFDTCLRALESAGDFYRMSGFWTCFYHNISDLFGMEQYFIKMHTDPEIVQAVTDRVCQFYYEANELFFKVAGDLVDGFFYGNDLGSQLGLVCSPRDLDMFVFPWFRKFAGQGHRFGHQVIAHSCGSVHKVIPRMIDAGVNCLHPIQALARDMNAERLAQDFKGKLAFLGGIDTQDLLTNETPEKIHADVQRVKKILGPNIIISPSHETLLPNVPPGNVEALSKAVFE